MARFRLITLLAGSIAVAAMSASHATGAAGADEDDCIRALPKPVINKTAAGVRDHTFRLGDDRIGWETAVVGTSRRVTIRHSGCAHYGISYKFPWTPPEGEPDPVKLLEAADRLMKQVEAVSASPGQEAFIRKALQGAAAAGSYRPGESIEMTEGYSYSSVREEKDPDGGSILVVSYEVIL